MTHVFSFPILILNSVFFTFLMVVLGIAFVYWTVKFVWTFFIGG